MSKEAQIARQERLKKLIRDIHLGSIVNIAYEDGKNFVGLVQEKSLEGIKLTDAYSFKGDLITLRSTRNEDPPTTIPYHAIKEFEVLKSYLE